VLQPPDDEWVRNALKLLEPSLRFDLQTQTWGWRAGVRAGMPDE
jgi:hypothetical protein